jgi:hypothetical protein
MFVRPRPGSLCLVPVFFVALGLMGCWKKSGEAIVVAKEHIDVAEIKPSPSPGSSPVNEESVYREIPADEIDVDGIVMKKDVRGTSKDPRAGSEEKWLVKVELVEVSRRFNIYTDRAHYDKVKVGDRIKVRYSEGKYTGTVWGSEIVD